MLFADLAEGDRRLPFRVEGRVFHQVIQQWSGRYQIVLVHPVRLDPADRTVVIHSPIPGVWSAIDRLTGQGLAHSTRASA